MAAVKVAPDPDTGSSAIPHHATTTTTTRMWDDDPRNVHRDKAQVLLRMADAIEDSSQRRRKAAASYANNSSNSSNDHIPQPVPVNSLLVQDLNQLALDLQTNKGGEEEKTSEDTDPSNNYININTTLQDVLTSVFNLREHSHLKYQMLELKYFDLKRHVFDVEAQNRRLRLGQLQQQFGHYSNTNNVQSRRPLCTDTTTTTTTFDNEQLMAQLQQENSDLRKQLQDNCGECRRLVQENYGLRKILLENGVSPQKIRMAANTKLEGHDEEESSENDDEGFEDCQEFDDPNCIDEQASDELASSPSHATPPDNNGASATITQSRFASSVSATKNTFSPILRHPPNESTHDTTQTRDKSTTTANDDNTTTTSASGQKRGSRKSVTFAAMATALVKDRPMGRISSSASVVSYDSNAFSVDGRSVATAPPSLLRYNHTSQRKKQQQHDKNLALLGGIFTASAEGSEPEQFDRTSTSSRYDKAPVTSPLPRRKSYSAPQSSSRKSSTSSPPKPKKPPQQVRRYSHGDALRTYHNQAICAKQLQQSQALRFSNKNKGNTFQIHMSSFLSSADKKNKKKSAEQVVLSPEENSRRLSELLGGFRPGSTTATATTEAEIAPTSMAKEPTPRRNTLSSSYSMFGRRRNSKSSVQYSNHAIDDDDNMSVGSARSLGSFLFGSKKKKNRQRRRSKAADDRSIGSHGL